MRVGDVMVVEIDPKLTWPRESASLHEKTTA
jgi:hypothetical protein